MRRFAASILALSLYGSLAGGCSSPTEPDNALPTNIPPYQYTTVLGKRFYEIRRVPDVGSADTLFDSLVSVSTDPDGVYWARAYRAFRHFAIDSTGELVPVGPDSAATTRREGYIADSLLLDPSLRYRILVAPITPGRTWQVNADTTMPINAEITGEQTLSLNGGAIRTWHVDYFAFGEVWWAPGLGRVQYEEIDGSSHRIRGTLIAVGKL
jgi:hypothetical protein